MALHLRHLVIGVFVVSAALSACGTSGSGCPSDTQIITLPPPPPKAHFRSAAAALRDPLASNACPLPPERTPVPIPTRTAHP